MKTDYNPPVGSFIVLEDSLRFVTPLGMVNPNGCGYGTYASTYICDGVDEISALEVIELDNLFDLNSLLRQSTERAAMHELARLKGRGKVKVLWTRTEEETPVQKEIREIRETMETQTARLKALEAL